MVFEYQTLVHNLIVKANFTARQALHFDAGLNEALGNPSDERLESAPDRERGRGAFAGEERAVSIFVISLRSICGPSPRFSAKPSLRFGRSGSDDLEDDRTIDQ